MILAVTVSGILRHPTGRHVLNRGKILYLALAEMFPTAMLEDEDRLESLEQFLHIEGIPSPQQVLPTLPGDPEDITGRRLAQLLRLRRSAPDILGLMDPSPDVCADLHSKGFRTLCWQDLVQMPTTFTPARWNDIAADVDRQRSMKADRREHAEKARSDGKLFPGRII